MRVDYGGYGRIAALFVAASLILGWGAAVRAQSAANAPEAHAFTPPPRSIADITAILDREKPDPAKIAEAKQRADAQPPSGASDVELQKFYSSRGEAADNLGRSQQAITDFGKAVDLAQRNQANDPITYAQALSNTARANRKAGNTQAALQLYAQEADIVQRVGQKLGMLFTVYEGNASDAFDALTFYDWRPGELCP